MNIVIFSHRGVQLSAYYIKNIASNLRARTKCYGGITGGRKNEGTARQGKE